jgi:hypothetical protein
MWITGTEPILARREKRGAARCGASCATSDAAMGQNRPAAQRLRQETRRTALRRLQVLPGTCSTPRLASGLPDAITVIHIGRKVL